MITPVVQRWRDRRGSYRPADETIRPSEYTTVLLRKHDQAPARRFVEQHHYEHTWTASRKVAAFYRKHELVGVAVFAVPVNFITLDCLPEGREGACVLSRFVLLDDVPGNGETRFLGEAFELLRGEGLSGVVSFSDPVPRRSEEGRLVMPGHVGTIYQAHNAIFLGRARADTMHLLPDGTTFHNRAAAKIRKSDRGAATAIERLVHFGATPPLRHEDPVFWIERWRAKIARAVHHPGNFKYAWALDRVAQKAWRKRGESRPYPKFSLIAERA